MKMKTMCLLSFSFIQANPKKELVIFDGPTIFVRDESVAKRVTGIGVSNGGLGVFLKSWTKWDTVSNTAEDDFYKNFKDIEDAFQSLISQDILKRQKDVSRAIRNESGKVVPPLLVAILNGDIHISVVAPKLTGINQKIAKTLEPENLSRIMKVKDRVLRLIEECRNSGNHVLILSGLHPEVSKKKKEEHFGFLEDGDFIHGVDYDLNALIASRGTSANDCIFVATPHRQDYPKSCGLQVITHTDRLYHQTLRELKKRNLLDQKTQKSDSAVALATSSSS